MFVYDDLEIAFTDFIRRLLQDRESKKSDNQILTENVYQTCLRLLGYVDGDPDLKTFTHGLFKSKNPNVTILSSKISSILSAGQSKLSGYDKVQTYVKLKRINKLVESDNFIDYKSLVSDSIPGMRNNITKKLKELRESNQHSNLLGNEIAINNAVTSFIDNAAEALPDNVEYLKPQLISLMRNTATDAYKNIYELSLYKESLIRERDKLQQIESILSSGQAVDDGDGSTLSLKGILGIFIFLTKQKYQCSECKFYKKGKFGEACIYASTDHEAVTKSVTTVDDLKNEVNGHYTKSNNSCKEVWGLVTNDYFVPSKEQIEKAEKILKE